MESWDIEDRNNDWLAEEMRREGYNVRAKAAGGVLKAAHSEEEHFFRNDWKTGAVANKRQHEVRHAAINVRNASGRKSSGSSAAELIVGIVFFIIFVLFFVLFFESAIF